VICQIGYLTLYPDVFIDEIHDGTFYARLVLINNGSTLEIDARPSDCISLAIRVNASIMICRSVFESSLITEDELEENSQEMDQ